MQNPSVESGLSAPASLVGVVGSAWVHKDLWHRHGKDFMVEVKRYPEPPSNCVERDGGNRWNVYAYIYPKHPVFGTFEGDEMWQPATAALPLHCGCSYLRVHRDDSGNITCVQAGSDYNHLHDSDFSRMATAEDASIVFRDAGALFDHLQAAFAVVVGAQS